MRLSLLFNYPTIVHRLFVVADFTKLKTFYHELYGIFSPGNRATPPLPIPIAQSNKFGNLFNLYYLILDYLSVKFYIQ